MRCAKRRFQPSPNTARQSLENYRGGLDGLGVFLYFDSDIETEIPQNKTSELERQQTKTAMGYLLLFVLVFRLSCFKTLRQNIRDETVSYYNECPS